MKTFIRLINYKEIIQNCFLFCCKKYILFVSCYYILLQLQIYCKIICNTQNYTHAQNLSLSLFKNVPKCFVIYFSCKKVYIFSDHLFVLIHLISNVLHLLLLPLHVAINVFCLLCNIFIRTCSSCP